MLILSDYLPKSSSWGIWAHVSHLVPHVHRAEPALLGAGRAQAPASLCVCAARAPSPGARSIWEAHGRLRAQPCTKRWKSITGSSRLLVIISNATEDPCGQCYFEKSTWQGSSWAREHVLLICAFLQLPFGCSSNGSKCSWGTLQRCLQVLPGF